MNKLIIDVASEKILQLVLMQCMIRQNCTIFADDLDGYLSKNNSRILHLLTYHRHKKLSLDLFLGSRHELIHYN